jgi:GT2 family glycosyltransferase
VSVILPARTDSPGLRLALEALKRQTFSGAYEVVVVCPEDLNLAPYPRSRLVRECRNGPGAALNAGVRAACGDILAFTDIDCVPASRWIEAGVIDLESMRRPGLVAGRIVQTARDAQRPNAVETFEVDSSLRQDEDVRHGVASASNLFITSALFDAVGPFREDLASKSDWEFCLRAREAGYDLVYCHDAEVSHRVIATWYGLWRSKLRLARGMLELGNARRRSGNEMRREALAELRLPVRTMLRALSSNRPVATRVGLVAAIVVTRASYVAGWVLAEVRTR